MFCNQCGHKNIDNAKFCSSCGNKLVSDIETPPPIQTQKEIPSLRKKQIELWNPNAAANWSLLFSPAFGAYLHMKNWEALGDSKKAKQSKVWFYIGFLSLIYPLGFFVLIAWYFSIGKKQAKYVKEKYGDRYTRKSWSAPLLIGFSIFIVSVFLIILIPENKNIQTQQNPPHATQPNQFDKANTQNKGREANGLQCESKSYKASKYGLDFYGLAQYSITSKNPIVSQLNWGVTNFNPELNPSSTSGSIRVELRALPKSIEDSLESYLIGTYYPNFSNSNNVLNVGSYASNITSTAESSSIPSGSYCIVALLQEYSSDCKADENYCGVAWIQFKNSENF